MIIVWSHFSRKTKRNDNHYQPYSGVTSANVIFGKKYEARGEKGWKCESKQGKRKYIRKIEVERVN
jgi:hypothetical protein